MTLHLTFQVRILTQVMNLALHDSEVYADPTSACTFQATQEEHVALLIENTKVTEKIMQEIDFGPEVSHSMKEALWEMFQKHQEVFSATDDDLGFCDKHTMTEGAPVKVPHRRIPPHEWQEVRDHLSSLLQQNVIRESHGPFESPVVLVRKKYGSLSLCVDYRALTQQDTE